MLSTFKVLLLGFFLIPFDNCRGGCKISGNWVGTRWLIVWRRGKKKMDLCKELRMSFKVIIRYNDHDNYLNDPKRD